MFEHPVASVIVTVYDPTPNELIVPVVDPLDHEKVYGAVPLLPEAVMVPLAAPLQVISVKASMVAVMLGPSVKVTVSTSVQPFASVAVTV